MRLFKKNNRDNKKVSNREEQLFDLEFDFTRKCLVQINWSASFCDEIMKTYDCSFDASCTGLDIFVVGLNNYLIPDESSLLFYNSVYKTEAGLICNQDKSIVCQRGIDINKSFYELLEGKNDDYDTIVSINFNAIKLKYDKILFLIGRPHTDTPNSINWIDEKRIKEVNNEVIYVDLFFNNTLVVHNIRYYYNQNGAMTLFEFCKTNNKWGFNINHDTFKQGLKEIIEKYYKTGPNLT